MPANVYANHVLPELFGPIKIVNGLRSIVTSSLITPKFFTVTFIIVSLSWLTWLLYTPTIAILIPALYQNAQSANRGKLGSDGGRTVKRHNKSPDDGGLSSGEAK